MRKDLPLNGWLLLITVLGITYAATGGKRLGHFSLSSLFVYAQGAMAIGTIPLLESQYQADRVHLALIVTTYAVLVLTSAVLGFSTKNTRANYQPEISYHYPRRRTWLLVGLSIAVSALYFWAVGYVAFFDSLQSVLSNDGTDVAALRLESYAGDQYFFPGYVNQFKNALLPGLAIVVAAAMIRSQMPGRKVAIFLLGAVTLLFLLGTGQRGAFVTAALIAIVFCWLVAQDRFGRVFVITAVFAVPFFFLSTIASGRTQDAMASADGVVGQFGVLVEQLVFRLFGSNQFTSVVGFRYIYNEEIAPASEWGQALLGLLPGSSGSDLSNQIFYAIYGSPRGTAPLSLWGSSFHNIGFFATVILAILLAIVFFRISAYTNALSRPNTLQIVGLAGITVILGTWIADAVTSPINTGLVVFVFLAIWGSRLQRKTSLEESAPALR